MFQKILSDILGHVARRPDSPALITTTGVVTFGELGARVGGIRRELAALPAGNQMIIGQKEPDCVAAMIACALEGRAFVFADRSYPTARIELIARVGRTRSALIAGSVPADIGLAGLRLSSVPSAAAPLPAEPMPPPAGDDAVFYIVFTSGSTGEPKGVPITRRNYAALHAWYAPLLATASDGAHVNHSSFTFDMGMFDLWPPLALGRPVILLEPQNNVLPYNNVRHLQSCAEVSPASWASTPSLLRLMCTDRQFAAAAFPKLQFFVIGGEMLPRPLIRELMQRFPDARIYNGYGPSEATCCTHLRLLTREDLDGTGPIPAGPAVGRSRMHVIDADGVELPAGIEGEVVLSGPQVVSGYLPEDHPSNRAFGWRKGERTYRTGDLGRIDADGSLILLGRTDRQVKLLGNRIELDEIERVADDCPGIRKSVCIPVRDGGRVISLVLFAQLHSGSTVSPARLQAHLGRFLSAAAVPRDLRLVTSLPVTINGKVDTRALLQEAGVS
jgi:D-alanine--poly(phosphoribitol) ligase subunit 1